MKLVTAKIVKNSSGYVGFSSEGHAGYDIKGKDIVCSAISMLTINTANSIIALTDSKIDVSYDEGFISWKFKGTCDERATLLMDAMLMGLRSIEEDYDDKYLTVLIEEAEDDQVRSSVICS